MKILNLEPSNCKNCYKCVRNCPVKAIKMIDDKAQIVEDRCVACGKCFLVCPQNARFILTDLEKILSAIKSGKKVIVSIAPSYLGIFESPYKLIGALKKLGVHAVEETAIGAAKVTEMYIDYINSCNDKVFITTCCPSANLMVQTYYPELLPYLLPIDSPMICHSKLLKEKYGEDAFVVFLGPCISKKCEAYPYQQNGVIDAVLSFEELEEYFYENHISLDDCQEIYPEATGRLTGKKYPIEKGILAGLEDVLSKKGIVKLPVSGSTNLKKAFEAVKNNQISNVCLEVNMCQESCIGGPAISKNDKNIFVKKLTIQERLQNNDTTNEQAANSPTIDFRRMFRNKSLDEPAYTEEQIQAVLESIGKHSIEDELNCGSCGYSTCREKAISVLNGMSHSEMCIPYMRSKAERISNISFEYSPNILFIVDQNLNILDFNPMAEKAFNVKVDNIRGSNLSMLMDTVDFEQVLNTQENIINKRVDIEKYGLVVYSSIIYLPKLKLMLCILLDVTNDEKKKNELLQLKMSTIETANQVIEKQMRVAQEIAGLLGETTAETKSALLSLKKVVKDE